MLFKPQDTKAIVFSLLFETIFSKFIMCSGTVFLPIKMDNMYDILEKRDKLYKNVQSKRPFRLLYDIPKCVDGSMF